KLKERNPKWINDDYVKFLRYGQYYIEKNGSGVLAFINPHGYLDNPTFRGMRWNLLKTYDKIYTIDLHGNSKKKETAPDGTADVNVFDIQQGVSINIFVKTGQKRSNELGKVYHYDLFGKRDWKYEFLWNNTLKTVQFTELQPTRPNFFFVQKDFEEQKQYEKGFAINEIFPVNSVGIVTARDNFTIHETLKDLKSTIEQFLSIDDETARKEFYLGKDVRDWQVNFARADLKSHYPDKGTFCKISYRPFDDKWTYFTGKSKGFHCYPRNEVMQQFVKESNIGFVVGRQSTDSYWSNIQVTENIIDNRFHFSYKGISSVFPLYIFHAKQETNNQLFSI
ncbi:MAG: type ISP restriction/modification enzyme, partial [Ignavibacteria bacterium]|nr:type ISP restriction/modification enzyme [Ignavibacteria bacterium]